MSLARKRYVVERIVCSWLDSTLAALQDAPATDLASSRENAAHATDVGVRSKIPREDGQNNGLVTQGNTKADESARSCHP